MRMRKKTRMGMTKTVMMVLLGAAVAVGDVSKRKGTIETMRGRKRMLVCVGTTAIWASSWSLACGPFLLRVVPVLLVLFPAVGLILSLSQRVGECRTGLACESPCCYYRCCAAWACAG